jgi:uncharacterized membrane protein YgcG
MSTARAAASSSKSAGAVQPTARLTANWYDAQEMACMQRTCVRRGLVREAVMAAVERDRSGDGEGAFASLVASLIDDIGLASPMSLPTVLASLSAWRKHAAAAEEAAAAAQAAAERKTARAYLAATVAAAARWPKSRLVADACLRAVDVDVSPVVSDMTTEKAMDEIAGHPMLAASVRWAASVVDPASAAAKRLAATTAASAGGRRLDAARAVALFATLARVASEVWADAVAPADARAPPEGTPAGEETGSSAVGDARRPEGEEARGGNEEDGEEEADPMVLEEGTALVVEETALALAHAVLSMESHEGRRVAWSPPRGAPARPPFLEEAMAAIGWPASSDKTRAFWPTLAARAGCREFFGRPAAWLFEPLLAIARDANRERLVMVLVSLMETLARGLAPARSVLTAAVLVTARHSILEWAERAIDIQAVAAEPDVAAAIESYDAPAVRDTMAALAAGTLGRAQAAAAVAAARRIEVDPAVHLDGTTRRERGFATLPDLEAALAAVPVPEPDKGADEGDAVWSDDESRRSHGPALCEAPSDDRLAGAAAVGDPACESVANHYAHPEVAEAAARLRAWADDGGDAATLACYPRWVEALADPDYRAPAPPASSSRKASGSTSSSSSGSKKGGGGGASAKRRRDGARKTKDADGTGDPASDAMPLPSPHPGADDDGGNADSIGGELSSSSSSSSSSYAGDARLAKCRKGPQGERLGSGHALLATVRTVRATTEAEATRAVDLLVPGRLLRIVEVVYEEVDADHCPEDTAVRLSPVAPPSASAAHAAPERAGAGPTDPSTLARGAAQGPPPPSPSASPSDGQPVAAAVGTAAARKSQTAPRVRSRATDALAPCPDIVATLRPTVLDAERAARLRAAPLAQKSTLTTKKKVFMLDDGAYKGPYMVRCGSDVKRVLRTLYRERVMRDLWGDEIVVRHEPVLDGEAGAVYLRMALVGDRGPEHWKTKRPDGCDAEVVDRESHGLVVINTMEWLGSEQFVEAFPHVVIHMAARYMIGGGDANLNNILGCPSRGASSVTAVDIEDMRDNSKGRRKGSAGGSGASSSSSSSSSTTATAAGRPDSLMRCLFTPGRGPKAQDQPTFDALLMEHIDAVRAFVHTVRATVEDPPEGTDAADCPYLVDMHEYARSIGYVDAAASEIPTRSEISARLDRFESFLNEFEASASGGSSDGN